MSKAAHNFRMREATRLIRSTVKAGFSVARIEVDRDGVVSVIPGPTNPTDGSQANDFDQPSKST